MSDLSYTRTLNASFPAAQSREEFNWRISQGEYVLSTITMGAAETPAPGVELDKLLLIIEAGLRVRLRHHFFNWTQGPVQTLLPHDLLICGIGDSQGRGYQIDSFSCYPQPAPLVDALRRREVGIAARLVQAWEKNGCDPLLLGPGVAAGPAAALAAEIAEHKLGELVAHGTCGLNGFAGTFFAFCCLPGGVGPQHAYVVELLVPYLHAAWTRIHYRETVPAARSAATAPAAGQVGVLTGREIEILRWVYEGKSNIEIGMILDISGFTVKNHVQNILRKLNVQNRTQAVAKGLLLNLLQGGPRG